MFSRLIPQKGAEVILSSNLVSADVEIFMLFFSMYTVMELKG